MRNLQQLLSDVRLHGLSAAENHRHGQERIQGRGPAELHDLALPFLLHLPGPLPRQDQDHRRHVRPQAEGHRRKRSIRPRFAIPVLDREMSRLIAKYGRNSELWLVLGLYLKSRQPLAMLKMAPLGLKLMKTGRMSLRKESIKNKNQLRSLLKAVKEECPMNGYALLSRMFAERECQALRRIHPARLQRDRPAARGARGLELLRRDGLFFRR